jgi:hypothetical protein
MAAMDNCYILQFSEISFTLDCSPKVVIGTERRTDWQLPITELAEMQRQDMMLAMGSGPNPIPRRLPTRRYNCHSLSFASRRGWLEGESKLQLILGSEEIAQLNSTEEPLPGDIIAYQSKDLENQLYIAHTGVIVEVPHGVQCVQIIEPAVAKSVLVISKWGQGGEYVHAVNRCPYFSSSEKLIVLRHRTRV